MSPTYALIIDTETTGLDPTVHRCIEVACCLFDLRLGIPLASYASLIRSESNEAEPINRIPVAALVDAQHAEIVWRSVGAMFAEADVIVAHRAEFDRGFVAEHLRTMRPWVCSKFHLELPLGKSGDHLTHLALAHGLGVMSAHRAMADVDTLARILSRVHEMGHPLPALIERAMRPRVKVIALTSYDEREMTKAAGFAWEPTSKTWWKEMVAEDVAALPFRTRLA